jgi:hypothetical protein
MSRNCSRKSVLEEEVSTHGASSKWYATDEGTPKKLATATNFGNCIALPVSLVCPRPNCEIHKELLMSLPLLPSVNANFLVEITLVHDDLSVYRKFVPHHVLRIFQYPELRKNDHILAFS